jgi:hypothetical protein
MSKENLFGNTIYRNQVNGVKVVFTCHKHNPKSVHADYICLISYKIESRFLGNPERIPDK